MRTVESNVRRINPRARIIRAESPVTVEDPDAIRGKRVLVVEDGPTVTHGEMRYGAGHIAARRHGRDLNVRFDGAAHRRRVRDPREPAAWLAGPSRVRGRLR